MPTSPKKNLIFKIVVPSISVGLCLFELILSSIYQFQKLGFAYSAILLLVSLIYLYQGIQNKRIQVKIKTGLEPMNPENRLSPDTKAIMRMKIREQDKKNSNCLKALFVIYCMAMLLMSVMIITRFFSLVAH